MILKNENGLRLSRDHILKKQVHASGQILYEPSTKNATLLLYGIEFAN